MEFFDNFEGKLKEIRKDGFYKPCMESVKEEFEKLKTEKFKYMTFSFYMEFFKSGDRTKYDEMFNNMHFRVKYAFLLYLYYQEKIYLDDICDMIWVMAGLPTWCAPEHIANDWNADFSDYRGHIDLYAAEFGFLLAQIYHFFNEDLPKEIKFVIEKELESRIFTPFESRNYWWEPKTNNWSAVCGGSVGMTYMLVYPERFGKIKPRILSAMEAFVSSYGDDGCCTEGLGYWGYGFGYYIYFADMLYRFSGGKEDIRYGEKIVKMAMFATHGFLDMGIGLSFADCGRKCGFGNTGLLCYLTENYEGFTVPKISFETVDSLNGLIWTKKELVQKTYEVPKGMYFYDKTGWYINRKGKYSFGAKAGHNDEEHNHNDIGSFIFADKESQILIDIGAMLYDRDNFNQNRYDEKHIQNSSLGHSVPIIDGKAQKEGKEFYGRCMDVEEDKFSLEIHKAYDIDLSPVVRSFELKENGITLTDTFHNFEGHTAIERFVSFIKPEIRNDSVIIGSAVIKSDRLPKISSIEILDRFGVPEAYYLLDYKVDFNVFVLTAEIK